jgi:Uma2 family endonuclease
MSAAITKDINSPEDTRIPEWVNDFATFNRWTDSLEFPETGHFSFIHGRVWVDMSMEQLFTHNLLKAAIIAVFVTIAKTKALGYVFSDGARLRHINSELSVEPDVFLVSYEAIRAGRVTLTSGTGDGFLYVDGSPELVVEIVSDSSERKDLEVLREGYFDAGVTEYWLVDARREQLSFDLLKRGEFEFEATTAQADGWLESQVFGKSFRITQTADPLGHPQFTLEHRD